jgi:predicted NUDIX family phosphoesterase
MAFLKINNTSMRLKAKIVLVTGSARGIGQTTAELFHNEGAIVIVSDIRDKEGRELAERLGKRAEYLHLDVKEEDEWIMITDYIERKYGQTEKRLHDMLHLGVGGHLNPRNSKKQNEKYLIDELRRELFEEVRLKSSCARKRKNDRKILTKAKLAAYYDDLETWSKIAIDYLYDEKVHLNKAENFNW